MRKIIIFILPLLFFWLEIIVTSMFHWSLLDCRMEYVYDKYLVFPIKMCSCSECLSVNNGITANVLNYLVTYLLYILVVIKSKYNLIISLLSSVFITLSVYFIISY